MEIKTFLKYWNESVFLFDVVITERERKQSKTVAKGRAIVNSRPKRNGQYAGHCCLIGDHCSSNEIRRLVVRDCVKKAIFFENYIFNTNKLSPSDSMIYIKVDNQQ